MQELQDFLISKGFLTTQSSGIFFSLTRNAVVAYQKSIGLPATGFVGPLTRTQINNELISANASSTTEQLIETGTTISTNQNNSKIALQLQIQDLLNKIAQLNTQITQLNQNTQTQIQKQTTPPIVNTPVQINQPAITPTPSCTQDTWNCSDWSTCSSSGSQTRICNMTFDCASANTLSPNIAQNCTPPTPVTVTTPAPVIVTPPPFVSDMSETNITSSSADISFTVKKYGVWVEVEWSESNSFDPDVYNVQKISNWCSYSNNTAYKITLAPAQATATGWQPKFKPNTTYYYRIIGKDGCPDLGGMIPQDYNLTLMNLQHTFQYSSDIRSFTTLP